MITENLCCTQLPVSLIQLYFLALGSAPQTWSPNQLLYFDHIQGSPPAIIQISTSICQNISSSCPLLDYLTQRQGFILDDICLLRKYFLNLTTYNHGRGWRNYNFWSRYSKTIELETNIHYKNQYFGALSHTDIYVTYTYTLWLSILKNLASLDIF